MSKAARPSCILAASLLAAFIAAPLAAQTGRSEPLPPPAPAGHTERQEAEAAIAAGTNAALIRFLARHPTDPSAPRIRAALSARTGPDPADANPEDPDAAAIAAFDAARLRGTATGWAEFLRRFPGHPLTVEARHWQ
ncbi:hypothetical protein [Paracoccus ravus]|uniref:hypothetical protein n=1 Tax=Paracoccus ravus TaxID=2447760 RepID=UPI00106EDA0C|nr:hypothetical protein [Paracoccus ravus]